VVWTKIPTITDIDVCHENDNKDEQINPIQLKGLFNSTETLESKKKQTLETGNGTTGKFI
jgi:hypothetical protein